MPKPRKRHSVRRSHGALASVALMALCFVVSLFCMGVLWGRALPIFDSTTVQFDRGESRDGVMPLSFDSGPRSPSSFTVRTTLYALLPVPSRLYRLVPDDCLNALVINGTVVPTSKIATCNYSSGIVADLGEYMQAGANSIEAHISDGGGAAGFSLSVHPSDPILLSIAIATLLLSLWFVRQMLLLLGRKTLSEQWVALIVTVGSWLRVWYALNTKYHVRGHDVDGHIEYVRYLVQHWQLPPVHGGWQFYQPPLYYVLNAVPSAIATSLGLPDTTAMQAVSVLLSIVSLLLFASIVKKLWPKDGDLRIRCVALSLFVGFPGIVFFSGRINNDVLVFPLLLLVVLLLLDRATKFPRRWYAAVVVFALAVLTKTNALLLGPLLAASLLTHPSWNRAQKWTRAVLGLILFLVATSWFFAPRFLEERSSREVIVGNVGALNGELSLKNNLPYITTFRPGQILTHPFNNPWSDEARRQYFWEYYFRSAFFGEFGFSPLLLFYAQGLLALWLLLLPWCFLGIARWLEKPHPVDVPFLVMLVSFLCGHLLFRLQFPFGSSQDFRYSAAIVVPMFWLLLSSTSLFSGWARKLFFCLLWISVLAEALFIVGILLT